jgi:hypothetical protein
MRRLAPRLVLLSLAWLTATGSVGMCKLFRPATPELGGSGVLIPTNYSDPDSTLTTLARGIAGKGNGLSAYMGGIAQDVRDGRDFNATFDPAVLARYNSSPGHTVPNPFGADLERTFFFNFVQYMKGADYSMSWGPDNFNPIDQPPAADTALVHRSYQVTAHLSDGSTSIIAVGYADLSFLHTAANRWVIVNWQDRVDAAYGGANPPNPEQVCMGWRRLNLR